MTTDMIVQRCRRKGTETIGFSGALPVCWLPAGHDGDHQTIYGATIREVVDE